MANWPANTCLYCGHVHGSLLEKFECPRCHRKGCSQCLPTQNAVCIPCVQGERAGTRGEVNAVLVDPSEFTWPTS